MYNLTYFLFSLLNVIINIILKQQRRQRNVHFQCYPKDYHVQNAVMVSVNAFSQSLISIILGLVVSCIIVKYTYKSGKERNNEIYFWGKKPVRLFMFDTNLSAEMGRSISIE